jgi:hypothetical protein
MAPETAWETTWETDEATDEATVVCLGCGQQWLRAPG